MKRKEALALLGLDRSATPEEIKRAFRRAAKAHHPDTNPGDPEAEQRFKRLKEAYEHLCQCDLEPEEVFEEWSSGEPVFTPARGYVFFGEGAVPGPEPLIPNTDRPEPLIRRRPPPHRGRRCPLCGGQGQIVTREGLWTAVLPCPACKGGRKW